MEMSPSGSTCCLPSHHMQRPRSLGTHVSGRKSVYLRGYLLWAVTNLAMSQGPEIRHIPTPHRAQRCVRLGNFQMTFAVIRMILRAHHTDSHMIHSRVVCSINDQSSFRHSCNKGHLVAHALVASRYRYDYGHRACLAKSIREGRFYSPVRSYALFGPYARSIKQTIKQSHSLDSTTLNSLLADET